jgi:hypothetical protein
LWLRVIYVYRDAITAVATAFIGLFTLTLTALSSFDPVGRSYAKL